MVEGGGRTHAQRHADHSLARRLVRRCRQCAGATELPCLRHRLLGAGRVRPGPDRHARAVRRAAGRPHPRESAAERCWRPIFSISRPSSSAAANRASWAWRSRPTTRRAAASTSTSPTAAGDTVVARFRRGPRQLRSSPIRRSRFDLRWGGPDGARSSRSRSRITTAAIWCSVPTATSTSASATAARATIPDIARRTRASCSARCCASTSNVPDTDPIGLPHPARQSVSRRAVRPASLPEIWAFGCAIHGATASTIRARRHRRADHRRRRPEPCSRRSTTSRPGAAGATTAGATARARTINVTHAARSPLSAARRSHLRIRPQRWRSSVTGGFVYRGTRARRRRIGAATSSPTSSGPRLVGGAHHRSVDRRGDGLRSPRAHDRARRHRRRSATSAPSASTPPASCTSSATRAG